MYAGILPKGSVLVLSSGGIDSSACIAFFERQGIPVASLFVDYGQPAAESERRASLAVANHYGLRCHQSQWSGGAAKGAGVIRGRNAFLLLAGLMETGNNFCTIAIGLHAGSPYYDCSPTFVSSIQVLFDGYSDGAVRVSAPFLDWTKRQIWDFCLREQVPIDLTYSCEAGTEACGNCLSCRDLGELRAHS